MTELRIIRCTNAERIVYGGLEPGRMALETDTDIVYIGTAGGDVTLGGAGAVSDPKWNSDALPAIPSAQDDHFEAGSLDVKWTEWDLGVANLTVSVEDTFLKFVHPTEAADAQRGVYQTLPAGDFTIAAKVAPNASGAAPSETGHGLCLFEDATSATGDIVVLKNQFRQSGWNFTHIYIQKYSDFDSLSIPYFNDEVHQDTTCYLRIRRSGTTLYFEHSSDGVSWYMLYSVLQPFVPAQMGIISANANSGLTATTYVDIFRYIASNQIGPIGRFL